MENEKLLRDGFRIDVFKKELRKPFHRPLLANLARAEMSKELAPRACIEARAPRRRDRCDALAEKSHRQARA